MLWGSGGVGTVEVIAGNKLFPAAVSAITYRFFAPFQPAKY